LTLIVLCHVYLCILIKNLIDKLISIKVPWDQLEKLADVWNNKVSNKQNWGSATPTEVTRSINSVQELPPEVIAPNLKKMRKSAGFGTNTGNANRDS